MRFNSWVNIRALHGLAAVAPLACSMANGLVGRQGLAASASEDTATLLFNTWRGSLQVGTLDPLQTEMHRNVFVCDPHVD